MQASAISHRRNIPHRCTNKGSMIKQLNAGKRAFISFMGFIWLPVEYRTKLLYTSIYKYRYGGIKFEFIRVWYNGQFYCWKKTLLKRPSGPYLSIPMLIYLFRCLFIYSAAYFLILHYFASLFILRGCCLLKIVFSVALWFFVCELQ